MGCGWICFACFELGVWLLACLVVVLICCYLTCRGFGWFVVLGLVFYYVICDCLLVGWLYCGVLFV